MANDPPFATLNHVVSLNHAAGDLGNPKRVSLTEDWYKFSCVLLILLLFAGLLILPRIGQVVWIAIIAAIYIRVTLVIARREELLEEQSAARQDNQRLQ